MNTSQAPMDSGAASNAVLERLRRSRLDAMRLSYESGERAGRSWAAGEADFSALRNLDWFWNDIGDVDDYFADGGEDGAGFTASERLFFVMFPDFDGMAGHAADFWEKFPGLDADNHGHVIGPAARGFAEGALAVWREVKDRL